MAELGFEARRKMRPGEEEWDTGSESEQQSQNNMEETLVNLGMLRVNEKTTDRN